MSTSPAALFSVFDRLLTAAGGAGVARPIVFELDGLMPETWSLDPRRPAGRRFFTERLADPALTLRCRPEGLEALLLAPDFCPDRHGPFEVRGDPSVLKDLATRLRRVRGFVSIRLFDRKENR